MTDNEIIKAFKLCKEGSFEKCNECPIRVPGKDDIFTCLHKKQELTFDLINRQKAEIERLEKELKLSNADKVIAETHEKAAKEMFVDITQQLKTAKSEAIKEFAEMLKKRLCLNLGEHISVVTRDNIDNFVKEMTEAER